METVSTKSLVGRMIRTANGGTENAQIARISSISLALLLLLVVISFDGIRLQAQVTTADVVGTVTDQTGAIVPGARITITSLATGVALTTQSNSAGDFVFNLLLPGHYSLRIESSGFKKAVYQDLALAAGDRAREDGRLETGSVEESVTVTATPPLLQTDSSAVGSVVTEQSVQDLPLNGRNFINLVTVQPGVNPGAPDALLDGIRGDDRRDDADIVANGQADTGNNNMIDGMDNNMLVGNGTGMGIRPSIDAIAEVKVDTNDYNAEVGRNAGAVINVITKSGSNNLHGSAFEFFRNDIFDARNYFTTAASGLQKPEYRQNQFGGSIGGPIIRNKSFFFGDVEDGRRVIGTSSGLMTVPTEFERASGGTDFSDNGGTVISPDKINQAGMNYFKMFPAPNVGGPGALVNNFISAPKQTKYNLTADARIDQHFSKGDQLFGRYSYNRVNSFIPGDLPAVTIGGVLVNPNGNLGGWPGPSTTIVHNIQVSYEHVISPNLLLELKTGFTRFNTDTYGLNQGNTSAAMGVVNSNTSAAPETRGLMPVYFFTQGYSPLGDSCCFPILNNTHVFVYAGSLTYTHGAHNIKAGGQLIRRSSDYFQSGIPLGLGYFAGVTGNSVQDMIEGKSFAYYRSNDLVKATNQNWEYAAYVQDDWRVTHSLALNLGLRYEVFTPWTEAHGNTANFSYPTLSIITGHQDADMGIHTAYKNFSPRIGFSQSLWRGNLIRGGYGISYFPLSNFGNISAFGLGNPPYSYNSGFVVDQNWWPTLPVPTAPSTTNLSGGLTWIPKNFNRAYVEQFNLIAQQQIGANVLSIGGVGELTRHAQWSTNINSPAPNGPYPNDAVEGPPPPEPVVTQNQLPNVGAIQAITPWGTGNYYALQAVFARRLTNGLDFNTNYTLAHGLSNAQLSTGGVGSGGVGLISSDPHYDYGNSQVDIRSRFTTTVTYSLPFAKRSSGVTKLMLGGWESNLLLYWQTGESMSVIDGYTNAYGNGQANVVNGYGGDRPNVVPRQSYKKSKSPSINDWLNTAAFTPQPAGTPGNEKNQAFYGPHTRSANFSLNKYFNLTELTKLEFRAECYNLSNTANFEVPNNVISTWNPGPGHDATHPISNPSNDPSLTAVGLLPGDVATKGGGFGTITSTIPNIGNREFQFALKVLF